MRIREINGAPFVTYKGPRLSGPIKIRPEIELPLAEGTLADWFKIWQSLGFTIALAVRKQRDIFQYQIVIVYNKPVIGDIENKYDERFDDITYYTIGSGTFIGA